MVQTVSTARTNVYLGEHTLTPDELRAMDARIAASTSNVPDLGALMQYEADTAAWLKAHGCTDTRCQPDSAANGARHADEDTSASIVEVKRFYTVADFLADLRSGKLGSTQDASTGRLPLGTPVRLHNGVTGFISAHNPNDAQRHQVTWFDRCHWLVRHKFYNRGCFEVIGQATSAAVETTVPAA